MTTSGQDDKEIQQIYNSIKDAVQYVTGNGSLLMAENLNAVAKKGKEQEVTTVEATYEQTWTVKIISNEMSFKIQETKQHS